MTSLRLPPFYSGLWGDPVADSRIDLNFKYFKTGIAELPEIATVLRYAAVSDQINETKSAEAVNDDMLLTLSHHYMVEDVLLGICHLMHLDDLTRAEKLFLEDLPYTDSSLQIASYFFAMACLKVEADTDPIEADILVRMPKDELISKVTAMTFTQTESKEFQKVMLKFVQLKVDLYQAQLVQKQSGGTVDVGRFGHDEVYKRETIFGMAFCEDLRTLRVALNLAKHYDVSQFEVCFGHLEHLFINCAQASAIEERLQTENLFDILMQDRNKLKQLLEQRVFPILIGTYYDHIGLYYDLTLKCTATESEKKKLEIHVALLKEIDEHLNGENSSPA